MLYTYIKVCYAKLNMPFRRLKEITRRLKERFVKPKLVSEQRKYPKLEELDWESGRLAKATEQRPRQFKIEDKTYWGREFVSQQQLDINLHLLSRGISVEIPLVTKPVGEKRRVLYLGAGDHLYYLRQALTNPEKELIAKQIAEIISRMHNENIAHNDTHPSNFVMSKNFKVTLIDFKRAGLDPKLDWNNHEQIYFAFSMDYDGLRTTFHQLNIPYELRVKAFKTIVNGYVKMSLENKAKLFSMIEQEYL